ncbi:MAG: circularly permuted type 2 ATP-grasp protein [Parvibaculum sp.]|uniref:circularly permuted type 2 ATP-grasp protein n=1 Tax=Parvibaculum sp. TaxID=2024848 RepID=UPI0025F63CF5|nr:circularly permuted type 2 ATP-grasp protein [Parvibaculum sp.]MCE9648480.1 circularly permuted type 2 ATP-grasp protein [Parvibaculum sp.]
MPGAVFDEMGLSDHEVRRAYQGLREWLNETPPDILSLRREEAETFFRRIGITFAVYGEGGDPERIIPFDIIPRILEAAEWKHISAGLIQRVRALNAFIGDVYGAQDIVRAGIMPADQIILNDTYRHHMQGVEVPAGIYTHISGIDMVRVGADDFYVLEDNVRTPSGVSYMLENREITMRLFPDLFSRHNVAPVDHYCDELLRTLSSVTPRHCDHEPTVALLTPGIYNSAYYEHSFLADQMGVELVEGPDLYVKDDIVYMRTTQGPKRVDVIYRRVDDEFLDPLAFRSDTVLGVAGLMQAYRAGNVNLANAVGAGIADDKSTYTYVPEMIEFYLGEKPILRNVPTYRCGEASELAYVLERLDELVVKETHGSGGYGMLIGPKSTKAEREVFAARIKTSPDKYIAQPTLALSTCPTFVNEGIAPRHVDLRPFVLAGTEIRVVPGGLTRVALREGSLVVNSSQGGGTKDTWVLND